MIFKPTFENIQMPLQELKKAAISPGGHLAHLKRCTLSKRVPRLIMRTPVDTDQVIDNHPSAQRPGYMQLVIQDRRGCSRFCKRVPFVEEACTERE